MKMAFGMTLTGLSLLVLYFAALAGGYTKPAVQVIAQGPTAQQVYVNAAPDLVEELGITAQPEEIQDQRPVTLNALEEGQAAPRVRAYLADVGTASGLAPGGLAAVEHTEGAGLVLGPVKKVSPWWLVLSYFVISLGELMLSPMGLALVSKVAPPRMRGLMMGGWFVATAIGNKLTAIGAFWDVWSHARFFLTLSLMAFVMAIVLFLLIRPLKKAMPGV